MEMGAYAHTHHISLFRDKDRVLLAGDAVITVEQESLADVVIQKQELHVRPPILQRIHRRHASVQKLRTGAGSAFDGSRNSYDGKNYREDLLTLAENCIPFCKTPAKITGVFLCSFQYDTKTIVFTPKTIQWETDVN